VSSVNNHLRGAHNKCPIDEDLITPSDSTQLDQLDNGSQLHFIVPEVFRQKLLRMIAVLHLPFSIVESNEFRDLMLYSSPALRNNDTLPKSGASIKTWLIELLYVGYCWSFY